MQRSLFSQTMLPFAPSGLRALLARAIWSGLLGCPAIIASIGPLPLAQAQTSPTIAALPPEEAMFRLLIDIPSNYGTDVGFLDEVAADCPIVSETSVSLFRPTLPSVWWSRDQLPTLWRVSNDTIIRVEGYRLIRGWTAFYSQTAGAPIIDVQVDPQYWNRFNDFQQFAVLRQLGTAGLTYGHHVRIYNSIDLVGIHACDFTDVPAVNAPSNREVPLYQLRDVNCLAEVSSFVNYDIPAFGDDLFAPP